MTAPAPASRMAAPIRALTFTTLYPNAIRPQSGIFVENRLRHLIASDRVVSRVVAPVPWFPIDHPAFGEYGALARVPRGEIRHGLSVLHPRYPLPPKIGMSIAPFLLYAGAYRSVRRLLASGYDFELIDAHYFYPDGVAAVLLGRAMRKPVVITARGTDINLIPRYAIPRRLILWAASRASGMVTVCQALKDEMIALDVDGGRVRVLRNGVDLGLFRPGDREASRRRLGVPGRLLLSVGNLVPLKGHDLVIQAMPALSGATLFIVGDGPEEVALKALAQSCGVADRVRFLGRVAQPDLPALYGAADVLVLASSREGWANVLLEAMACGTPVVAASVGGTPEVVVAPEAGRLFPQRTPESIATAVAALLAAPPSRAATRAYAEKFSWDATTAGQIELFSSIIGIDRLERGAEQHHQIPA